MRKYVISAAIVVVLAISLIIGRSIVKKPFQKEYEAFWSIKVGMKDSDVVGLLGSPQFVYKSTEAPADYYVKGYSHKKREISHKVFVYVGDEPILYVYIDNQNLVEDVFVGGS